MSGLTGFNLEDVPPEFHAAVEAALGEAGLEEGHLAVEFVGADRIRELNRLWRDRDRPTDVLSFPVDEAGPAVGPRELGDVLVCPACCEDVTEAVVHGVLHLSGLDHEVDDGEMLVKQAAVMDLLREGEADAG